MKLRRYIRVFLLFRKVFKMDQYVFELVAGLGNLLLNLEQYLWLELSFNTFNWFCRNLNFLKRNTSLLKQQYDLYAKFFSIITMISYLILLSMQGGSLLLQTILSCSIKLRIILSSISVKQQNFLSIQTLDRALIQSNSLIALPISS